METDDDVCPMLLGARTRALWGERQTETPVTHASHESTRDETSDNPPDTIERLALRLQAEARMSVAAAAVAAKEIYTLAAQAHERLIREGAASLTQADVAALESVLLVRGRPALRVFGSRLESLRPYRGSEFWQSYLKDGGEARVVRSAAATGAVIVSAFRLGIPPFVPGSAWLLAPNRVVTNRHVLLSPEQGIDLVEPSPGNDGWKLRSGVTLGINFASDNATPRKDVVRLVREVLYLTSLADTIDLAVLEIDPYEDVAPLVFSAKGQATDIFVIGHAGVAANMPEKVATVFGELDNLKRVSFGRRLDVLGLSNRFAYDASTVRGFSGGPVIGIVEDRVVGIHYFGHPVHGNLAFDVQQLIGHPSYRYLSSA